MECKIVTSHNKIVSIDVEPDDIEYFKNPGSHINTILKQINVDRMYDKWLSKKKDMVILDIGANIGLVSMYMADSAKAVYSLEPSDVQFNILSKLTKNIDVIHPLKVALHDKNEELSFYIQPNDNTMNSSVNKAPGAQEIKVQGMTLKGFLDSQNIDKVDFCKIDIEGSEMTAINEQTVSEVYDRIDVIFIEVHSTGETLDWRSKLMENVRKLHDVFTKCGYKCDCPSVERPIWSLTEDTFDKIICYKD